MDSASSSETGPSKIYKVVLLVLVLAVIGVFTALLLVDKDDANIHKEGKAVDLNPDFRLSGNTLIIVNHDSFGYKELEATVNEDYHYKAASLASGASLEIPLREFAKKDGTRYSTLINGIQTMSLYTETTDGNYGKVELTHK